MTTFENYKTEARERWGETDAYKEFEGKTAVYTDSEWQKANGGLDAVLAEFAKCMAGGFSADSSEAQALVRKLKAHITESYYTCTDEILSGLGQMYVADERFKNSIDKNGKGTAEFVSEAIKIYCKK